MTTSDREALTAMFDRAGVVWHLLDQDEFNTDDGPHVQVDAIDKTGPNRGYSSFFAIFQFDAAGALTSVGVWE